MNTGDFFALVRGFTVNILLLFGTVLVYQVARFTSNQKGLWKNAIIGLLVGLIGVLIMTFPFQFETGLIFDARSVLYLISGYFFGPIVTFVGALAGIAYRIFAVGGGGAYAGVATIAVSSLLGLGWHLIERFIPTSWPRLFKFYLLGFVGHILVVLCQFLIIPASMVLPIIRMIAIPFLIFFPLATAIIALSLENNLARLLAQETILQQKLLLQSSVDSAQTIEIYALDKKYNYLTFNKFHADSMYNYYGTRPSVGDYFLNFVTDEAFRNRLQTEIDQALNGRSHITEAEIEVSPGKYFESHYNPIIDNHHQVIGVSVFSQDITQRINDEKQILHLSYHDSLTGLKNRRFYQEELERLEQSGSHGLVFVLFDINGLKIMNDAFGHHVGDMLLKMVADIISAKLPPHAEFMRIGGDEFVIIFYDATLAEVERIIDEIDAIIRQKTINDIHFSVSFGIESHQEGETIIDSIHQAEKKMYSRKLTEVTSSRHETIRAIINTLHVKHKAEEAHSARVSLICETFGQYLNLRLEEISLLKMMANIHDIGKIAIEESILTKPGPLTPSEWAEIKKHPEIGYHILLTSPEYAEIAEDILCHHERWDGTGYPRGLKGTDIPFRARMIAIADSFDAMTSHRPYRPAMARAQAVEEIKRNAGTQFDPELAAAFVEMAGNGEAEI